MVILPDQHANVAILLFAFSSDAESKRKRITKSQRVNKLLWKGLQAKTTRLLKEIGYDYVIFDENDQNGDNFGEKIAHAVQSVFDFGYEKVIVIGKDCPELSQRHISEAFHNLQTKNLVAGMDKRGGSYLIGITKNTFDRSRFSSLRWQTNELFYDLLGIVSSNETHVIETLTDLNDISDNKFISFGNLSFDIKKLLHSLELISLGFCYFKQPNKLNISRAFFNKGSPICI